MKNLLTLFLSLVLSLSLQAQEIESNFVYFDFDEFTLTSETQNELDRIIGETQQYSEFQLQIIGHTDQDGDDQYNNQLSEKRAQEVLNYFTAKSVTTEKITLAARGEQALFIAKEDAVSKSKNRRVEILTSFTVINEIEDLLQALSPTKNNQEFDIYTNTESFIVGDQGSRISIPANAFVFEDRTVPTGLISIDVIESFDFGSFAANGLECMSGDQMLETGGMMKITASSNGKKLKLADGKEIAIQFPPSNTKDDMKLFYGESPDRGVTDWILSDSEVNTEFADTETDIEFDFEQFLTTVLDRPEAPKSGLERNPKKPKYPTKPIKPFKPHAPTKGNIDLGMNFWQKATTSKKVKQGIIDQKYDEQLTSYTVKKKRYDELMELHAATLADYDNSCKKVDDDILLWEENSRVALGKAYDLHKALKRYSRIERVWFAQNYLSLNKDNEDQEKTFLTFHTLMNRLETKNEMRELLKYVFGPNYDELLRKLPRRNQYQCDHRYDDNQIADSAYKSVIQVESKANRFAFQYEVSTNKNLTSGKLGNYAMSISSLGWINCDRFYGMPRMQGRRIALVESNDATFYLVFHDIRSMLGAEKQGNLHEFKNIPVNQKVTVVGLQVIDNRSYLFTKELLTTENFKIAPVFKKSSITEINHVFDELSKRFAS